MRLNPEHFRALKLLGSALYALGDLREAESALRASLAINPDYSDTNSDLGARPFSPRVINIIMTRSSCDRQGASADKLQVKAPTYPIPSWTRQIEQDP